MPGTCAGSTGRHQSVGQGMTTRDIVNHLQDVHGISVSKDLLSRITDAVLEQMQACRADLWTRSIRCC